MSKNIFEQIRDGEASADIVFKNEYVTAFKDIYPDAPVHILIIPNKKIVIKYDKSKPNGTPRKVLDISLAKQYGWQSSSNLKESIIKTYNSYLKEI